MSLLPFPQALAMMNDKLDWTQQLGYAFATQEGDVMTRAATAAAAQAAGNLKSNEQQVVQSVAVVDDQGAPTTQQSIVIQPSNPQVVYVPTYNPTVGTGRGPIRPTRRSICRLLRATGSARVRERMAFMAGAAVVDRVGLGDAALGLLRRLWIRSRYGYGKCQRQRQSLQQHLAQHH